MPLPPPPKEVEGALVPWIDDILVEHRNVRVYLNLGHSAADAQSGPRACRAAGNRSPFDIVVTDYAMPGMNQYELAQKIRQRNPKLPIILATGYAELPLGDRLNLCIYPSLIRQRTWLER